MLGKIKLEQEARSLPFPEEEAYKRSCIVARKCTRQWALFRNFHRAGSARRTSSLISYAARGSASYSGNIRAKFSSYRLRYAAKRARRSTNDF